MTEKRFEKARFGTVIKDHLEKDTLWTATECIDRLNELADENEQLKQAVRELLDEYGNSYYIEIMDKLFNLDYDNWDSLTDWDKRCPYDWEEMVKGDVE